MKLRWWNRETSEGWQAPYVYDAIGRSWSRWRRQEIGLRRFVWECRISILVAWRNQTYDEHRGGWQ